MKKILILVSNARIGGVETLISRLLPRLDREKFEIDLILTHTGGVLVDEYMKSANVMSTIHCGTGKGESVKRCKVDAVKSMIRAKGYDIIHIFNLYELQEIITELGDEYNFVQSIHIDFTIEDTRVFWRDRVVASLDKIKAVIIDSKKNLSVLPQAHYVPNGIDTDLFKPLEKKPRSVAWVGRLTSDKGIDRAMNIIRKLPDYQFMVIGNEEKFLYPYVRDFAIKFPNLEVKTNLKDFEVAEVLGESEYFLFSSRNEGMPLAILEAMSCGCVVISSAVGAIPDVIQDGVNGYIFPNDLCFEDRVIGCFPTFQKEAGQRARETILEGYGIEKTVKRFEEIYDKF